MQRRAFLASVTAAVAGFGGCIQNGEYVQDRVAAERETSADEMESPDEGTVTTAIPPDRLIEIRDGALHPQVAEVRVGGLVRWANHDGVEHEITAAQFHDAAVDWEFTTGPLGDTEGVSLRFDEPGVYEYYCSTHGREELCGAVLVGDVELPGSLPCGEQN